MNLFLAKGSTMTSSVIIGEILSGYLLIQIFESVEIIRIKKEVIANRCYFASQEPTNSSTNCNSSIFGERAVASEAFSPGLPGWSGLFSDLSAWDACSLCILDFVELRVPPLISHEETMPSRQSHQKNPSTRFY